MPGATWEIALNLEGLGDVADIYERNVLYTSTTGPLQVVPGGLADIRADKSTFFYGTLATVGGGGCDDVGCAVVVCFKIKKLLPVRLRSATHRW